MKQVWKKLIYSKQGRQLALWAAGSTWAQLPAGSYCRLAHMVEHVQLILEADHVMYRARAS